MTRALVLSAVGLSVVSGVLACSSAKDTSEDDGSGIAGTGGAAQTLNSTNGNDGTAGGDTTFGGFLRARGGQAGKGGTATDGFGGASRTGNTLSGEGGNAHPTGGAPEVPAQSAKGPGGGGPGGGISAGNVLGVAAAGAPGSLVFAGARTTGTSSLSLPIHPPLAR